MPDNLRDLNRLTETECSQLAADTVGAVINLLKQLRVHSSSPTTYALYRSVQNAIHNEWRKSRETATLSRPPDQPVR